MLESVRCVLLPKEIVVLTNSNIKELKKVYYIGGGD
jgi:hypothetical protein